MKSDVAGLDDAQNMGVVIGYELLPVGLGDIAVEGEYTTTTNEGSTPVAGVNWGVDTTAVYAAFRSAGPIYLKAKAGYLYEDVSAGPASGTDSGLSAGVGVGFGIGIAQIELEYTQVEQDIDFWSAQVNLDL